MDNLEYILSKMQQPGVVRFSFLENELPDRGALDITFFTLRNMGFRVSSGYKIYENGEKIWRFIVERKQEDEFQDFLL